MDIIYIKNLRIETIIGIFDWEKKIKQVISIDLDMGNDITQAAKTDNIAHALDYKNITKNLIIFIQNNPRELIETLAEDIAIYLQEEFSIPWLKLRLSKPGALRNSEDVGIIIERGQWID